MTRREFSLAIGAAAVAAAKPQPTRIAITMDDFAWMNIPGDRNKNNRALLDTFARHSNLKIALFVVGNNVDNEGGRELLPTWNEAGHLICNHTYSHFNYNDPERTAEEFSADVLRCEPLLQGYSGFRKMLRFPALKEGETAQKRDAMRAFLTAHGYRNGHVTIDNSDWYYANRLLARLKKEPGFNPHAYRDIYLEHMWQCTTYYDTLAQKVEGRSTAHTLLTHYTLLNTVFLDDLLTMFESKGCRLISAEEAYRDPVFLKSPKIVPAGESLIWGLAKESPRHAELLRYPGENFEYEKAKLDRLGL